jgi:hypothetical protein
MSKKRREFLTKVNVRNTRWCDTRVAGVYGTEGRYTHGQSAFNSFCGCRNRQCSNPQCPVTGLVGYAIKWFYKGAIPTWSTNVQKVKCPVCSGAIKLHEVVVCEECGSFAAIEGAAAAEGLCRRCWSLGSRPCQCMSCSL